MNRITNNERRDSLSKNVLWAMLQELHYGPQGYVIRELHLSPAGVRVELVPQLRPALDYDPAAEIDRHDR